MWIDEEAYNLSMARDINCRPGDMSSIFKDARPFRYIKRLFMKGGADAIQRASTRPGRGGEPACQVSYS